MQFLYRRRQDRPLYRSLALLALSSPLPIGLRNHPSILLLRHRNFLRRIRHTRPPLHRHSLPLPLLLVRVLVL